MSIFCIIRQNKEKAFLYKLIETVFIILEQLPDTGTYTVHVHILYRNYYYFISRSCDSLFCQYCEKFLELITDLIVSFALLSSLCTHFSLLHVVSAINKKVFSDTA